eukprot:m51a1_g7652 hypothetical protein (129) ;mRNA; f:391640-392026
MPLPQSDPCPQAIRGHEHRSSSAQQLASVQAEVLALREQIKRMERQSESVSHLLVITSERLDEALGALSLTEQRAEQVQQENSDLRHKLEDFQSKVKAKSRSRSGHHLKHSGSGKRASQPASPLQSRL